MKRTVRILLYVLLVCFELGAVALFSPPWRFIALAPLGLIGFVISGMEREAWILAIVSGLVFDAFSLLPVGTFVVLFASIVWITRFLYRRWFTSRSWISLLALAALVELWFLGWYLVWRILLLFISHDELYRVTSGDAVSFVGFGILLSLFAFVCGLLVRDGVRHLAVHKRI